jgi:hypothetical protein
MNKFILYSLVPAGVISIIFFNGFSMITANKPADEQSLEAAVASQFVSGNIGDKCEWIAINTDSGACYSNTTSSFGPPDKLFVAVNDLDSAVSKADAHNDGFCEEVATLESTAGGIELMHDELGSFPVRWVCPVRKPGV